MKKLIKIVKNIFGLNNRDEFPRWIIYLIGIIMLLFIGSVFFPTNIQLSDYTCGYIKEAIDNDRDLIKYSNLMYTKYHSLTDLIVYYEYKCLS